MNKSAKKKPMNVDLKDAISQTAKNLDSNKDQLDEPL